MYFRFRAWRCDGSWSVRGEKKRRKREEEEESRKSGKSEEEDEEERRRGTPGRMSRHDWLQLTLKIHSLERRVLWKYVEIGWVRSTGMWVNCPPCSLQPGMIQPAIK